MTKKTLVHRCDEAAPRCNRLDFGELSKPVTMPNGFVRYDAYLTRTGVFEYRNQDGSIRRELRLKEEVFRDDSIETLKQSALTLRHPIRGTSVTAANARALAVGSVGQDVRADEDRLRSTVMVIDAETIKQMKSGTNQISCGYWCELEMGKGLTADGEEYDAIQRNIVYNHVALVDNGRAGSGIAARVDAIGDAMGDDGAVMVMDDLDTSDSVANDKNDSISETPVILTGPGNEKKSAAIPAVGQPDGDTMKFKLNIDGVTHEFEGSESAQQAITQKISKDAERLTETKADADSKSAALTKETSTLQAKLDASEEKIVELEKARTDAEDPAKLRKAVEARVALEVTSKEVLGEKFDSKDSDEALKRAIVLEVSPAAEAKLDGCTADYLEARFDDAVERFDAKSASGKKATEKTGAVRVAAENADGKGTPESRIDAARKAADAKRQGRWKEPLTTTKEDARA